MAFTSRAPGAPDTDYFRSSVTFSNTITDDTALPFTGEWTFQNDSSLSSLDSTYHTTTNAGDFVDFNFTGAFVLVPVSITLTLHLHCHH